MMMSVEKWANEKGYNRFYLYSLSSTIEFYEKCGFSVGAGEFVGCGDPVRMIKEPKTTVDDSQFVLDSICINI